MTRALNDAFEGAIKGLYPGLGEAIEAGKATVDIEGGGKLGVTRLKSK